jgi:hypothetical protein
MVGGGIMGKWPVSPARLKRRAEFAHTVHIKVYRSNTDWPHKTKMESVEHPGWYEWEVALVASMLDSMPVAEIYEAFFEPGAKSYKRRSPEDVMQLVRDLRRELT